MLAELSPIGHRPAAAYIRQNPGVKRSKDMASGGLGCKDCFKDHRKLCVCTVCLAATITVLTVMVFIRHNWRNRRLDPVLDMVFSAGVCENPARHVCELNISQAVLDKFDLHEHESPLLGFLFHQVARGAHEELRQVLSGAHIKLQDPDGSVYDFLRSLPGAWRRISSHRSSRPQYGVPAGSVLSALLVGTLDNSTWLQLEGSPWDPGHRPLGSLGHALDFLEYAIIRRNVGPLGTSKATDRQPLLAGQIAPTREACPSACARKAGSKPLAQTVSLAQVKPMVQEVMEDFALLRGAGGKPPGSPRAEGLVKLGGGGAFAAAGGIRVGSRFSQRLSPE
mmetsp:Transcript_10236/g.30802  ORF Transcript_10236/g.30802 Transcript_10236/m.30802 type:complete len:337 (-) Transcript_10236:49-1059(-)